MPEATEKTSGAIVQGLATALVAAVFFILLFWGVPRFVHLPIKPEREGLCAALQCKEVEVNSAAQLIETLHRYGLLPLEQGPVTAVLFDGYPADLRAKVEFKERKRVFINTLLPSALLVREEIRRDSRLLNKLAAALDGNINIDLTHEYQAWQHRISTEGTQRILQLTQRYKTSYLIELLHRVRPVPISLILAQGGIESAWGTSRFAVEGNNIFGIWTWDKNIPGMIPGRREKGKKHRVRIFSSLLDSVRQFCLILNCQPAYRRFRNIRRQTDNPLDLAAGLLNYSARRWAYVRSIQQVIKRNNLRRYDNMELTPQRRPL
ncbi:glucosaminidase domain-containing protein [Desulfobacterota bacterium M19]